ncbi:hypothetical protein PMIN04_003219 [Paraphaeosphaeria minitans]
MRTAVLAASEFSAACPQYSHEPGTSLFYVRVLTLASRTTCSRRPQYICWLLCRQHMTAEARVATVYDECAVTGRCSGSAACKPLTGAQWEGGEDAGLETGKPTPLLVGAAVVQDDRSSREECVPLQEQMD